MAACLLHRVLESLNSGNSVVDTIPSEREDEDDLNILDVLQNTLFPGVSLRALVCAWRAASDLRLAYDPHDSKSTRFMKCLGFQGIDVRGIRGFDTSRFGTVVYDYHITGREIITPRGTGSDGSAKPSLKRGGGGSGAGSGGSAKPSLKRGRTETGGRKFVVVTKFCKAL
jgi:hypothetical protein